MELNIYNKKGKLKATVSPADSSSLTEGLMTDYILSLSFVLFDCVKLDVNDYVDFLGKRYWMLEAYIPNQKSTIEWNYNTKFYGIESVIRRALCLKTVDNEMNAVFSLTAPAIEHVRLVVGNINRVMGTTDWKVGEVEATANLTIDYNGTYCDAALSSLAIAADTEYWIDGLTVNLCRCEHGELLSLGYENGLKEITLDTNENAKFFTRLFPLGSTRNIDPAKYGSTRLHLPGGVKYVEQNTHYGVIEHSEEAAFSAIYPRRVGVVGEVRKETKKGEDGKDFDIYYFTDPEIDFDPNKYEIGGLVKNIVFETGDLAGRDFEVNYNAEKKEFEVITQFPYDDNTQLPGQLVMKSGDEYILYNITMPTEYYARAEQEFATAVAAYMEKNKRDKSVYKAPTDYIDLSSRGIELTVGQRVHLMSDKYFPATGYRDSRITRITRKVNETLQADIEISDLANPGGKAVLTQGISEAKHYAQVAMAGLPDMIKSWENTSASDSNLYTAKKVDREIQTKALHRDRPDRTDFPLTMGGGGKFGNFTPGFLGSGGSIDENGDGEVRDLKVRGSLEVNEFRFNRIDVISGESWNTFAFGKFTSVDTEAQIATVDLVDGEMLTSHVNDINRGIFHNLTGGNSTDDGKDECGFKKVFGYTTSYFTPIELLPDGKSFRYSLKPGTTAHPCAEMKYAAYGNFTDKSRQSSSYETRTTEILLDNVNTWQIDADRHYMFIKGLLDGITIGGVELHGYSTFQRNGYLIGTQIQFTPEQLEEMKGNDAYSVSLSTYEGTVIVDSVGNVIGAMQAEHDVVSEDRQVVSADCDVVASRWKLSTRIQVFRGKTELVYGEAMRQDGFTIVAHAVGCEYKLVGGVISILKITDIDNIRLDLEINCEGMGVFSKTYHVTTLLDGNSVWATYHDSEDIPARPLGGGTENGWHRNLTMASLWVSQKNSRLVTDGEWGEPVPLHGDNAYTLNLTSDSDAILCDVDGKPLKKGTLASTVAQLYIGSLHQEQGVVYSMEAIGCGIEESKNTTGNVVVTGISEDAASVMVTALYKAKVVRKQYSLTRANGTAVYQLLPSSDVIKRSIKGSSYALYPEMLRCGVTRFDGTTSIAVNGLPDGYALKFSVPGGELQPYVLNSDLNTSNYPEGVRFSLFNETQVLIDHEVIPVVSDGEPHFKLDLSNENASVTCDKDGNVIGTIPPSVATVYAGSAIDKGWTFTAEFSGCTGTINTSGLITVTGLNADNATVAVTAIKGRYSDLVAAYTLSKVLAGADGSPAVVYWVLPSVTAIHKNKYGGCTPSSVVCLVMRQVGNVAPEVVSGEDLRYQLSTGQETAYTGAVAIGSAAWIDFALYGNGVVLDKERIPVVVDGSDGGSGDDGAPGADAKAVWLTSDVTQLVEAGVEIIPSSFTVYCKYKIGASGAVYNCYDFVLSVWRSADNINWSKVEEKLFGGSITVYPTSGYKYYTVRASLKPMSSFSSDFALSLSVNAVKNGTDGNPGANATSYWLASSVTQIVRNSIGNVEPSSFTVYCKKSEANEVTDYAGLYLSVWRSNDGTNWSQVGSAVRASSVNVNPLASYNQYVIRAGSVAIPSWGSSYALSVSVNMVKDGADGTPGGLGPMGSMPRLCGEFTSGQSYVWNSEFRDIVYKIVGGVNQLFMVGTFGRTVTTAPSSSTQNDADWMASSKWQFVATDTLLAEGANIAGFMYRAMKMISQAMIGGVPNLSLDGINGNIAIAGDGLLVIGDKGRTAYFEFNAKANLIKLYNTGGENLMSFGISSGVSWMELKSGSYTLTMYGSSITLSYGSRRVMLSPSSCSITDGSSEATIQSSSVRVKSGDKYTSIGSDSVNCVNAAGELAMLSPTELYFTKTGHSYS